jgi:methylmalonyl-CoA/ethylmalonyl-CoA epimerase
MFASSLPDKRFFQICVIVDDIERYAENYRTILGFEPGEVQITHDHQHTHATYHSKAMNARAKIVHWMLGDVAFELLQPIDPGSVWMDHLNKHGSSLHHVALQVPRTAPATAFFADKGYAVTQQGLFSERTGMYAYLDTEKDLGVTFELLEIYIDGLLPAPKKPFSSDKGIGTDRVIQVGLVVNDIAATVQRYREVLELPEPNQQQTPGYTTTEATFFGEPTEATAKLAFFEFGQAQLELIEPDQVPSVWRNDLNKNGQSPHHIAFKVEDTERAVAHFAKHGIRVSQQGYYGDRSGMYTYMDSQAQLGLTIELLENFAQPR